MSTPSNDGDNNTSNATNNSGSSTIRNNSSNRQTIHDERDFKQTPMFVVEKPSGQEGVVLKTVIIILLAFIIENNTQFSIAALFFKIFSQPVWMLFGVLIIVNLCLIGPLYTLIRAKKWKSEYLKQTYGDFVWWFLFTLLYEDIVLGSFGLLYSNLTTILKTFLLTLVFILANVASLLIVSVLQKNSDFMLELGKSMKNVSGGGGGAQKQ